MTRLGYPIRLARADNLLADGARSGAPVLAPVALANLAGFDRFAWRIAHVERTS